MPNANWMKRGADIHTYTHTYKPSRRETLSYYFITSYPVWRQYKPNHISGFPYFVTPDFCIWPFGTQRVSEFIHVAVIYWDSEPDWPLQVGLRCNDQLDRSSEKCHVHTDRGVEQCLAHHYSQLTNWSETTHQSITKINQKSYSTHWQQITTYSRRNNVGKGKVEV